MHTLLKSLISLALVASALPLASPALAQTENTPVAVAREVEPVVLTGAQIPAWSRLPAAGVAKPFPSGGSSENPASDEVRDAHNSQGDLVVPPDPRDATAVNPEDVVAYSYRGGEWEEIPVQVDERFPYFLANGRSDFGFYSYTDEELSYEWDRELWDAASTENGCEVDPLKKAAMQDPATTLDDDDEIVFMADDAGELAPPNTEGPFGTGELRQQVALADPLNPGNLSFVYLFTKNGGSSFGDDHYVDYTRHANANEYIDRNTFTDDDFEKLGTSNTGYGPNLPGTVCTDDPRTAAVEGPDNPRTAGDRFPRDGVTVSTDSYQWVASGRWMIREMHVTKPGETRAYGPDLVDRWKGRAFQQSPDSTISLVGFEDEQVNWEGNSSLLGELEGPVRAIREVWGADSGTNVTKTETFYRDAIAYRYRVRVHPIPPDGLYTSWDYNHDVASTYYNELSVAKGGVPIDGKNDDVGQVDRLGETPAFTDVNDPTFNKPLSILNWEQVSGKDDAGSLVYMFEFKNAQSMENPLVVPYYRDDACLDDGTGDDPSPRPWPGEAHKESVLAEYRQRPCYGTDPGPGSETDPNAALTVEGPGYSTDSPEGYRQGCFACHGIHYFVTGDTDNAMTPTKATEIDGQQWQWAAPTAQPTNVGDRYANTVKAPLVASVSTMTNTPEEATVTSVDITGASSGRIGETVTLSAKLSEAEDGSAVEGEELVFSLRGEEVGRATTGPDGTASVETTLTAPAEETQQTVAFAGRDDLAGASTTEAFTINKVATALEITGATTGQTTDKATLSARLTAGDQPLAGRNVEFVLGDQSVGSASTGEDGVANLVVDLQGPARSLTQTATFAGDEQHDGSSGSAGFDVVKEDTSLALALTKKTLTATLTDADSGTPIAGRTIRFVKNGKLVATATTDENGNAVVNSKHAPRQNRDLLEVVFDGDDTFHGTSAQMNKAQAEALKARSRK